MPSTSEELKKLTAQELTQRIEKEFPYTTDSFLKALVTSLEIKQCAT